MQTAVCTRLEEPEVGKREKLPYYPLEDKGKQKKQGKPLFLTLTKRGQGSYGQQREILSILAIIVSVIVIHLLFFANNGPVISALL